MANKDIELTGKQLNLVTLFQNLRNLNQYKFTSRKNVESMFPLKRVCFGFFLGWGVGAGQGMLERKEGGREGEQSGRLEPMFMVPHSVLSLLLEESIFC